MAPAEAALAVVAAGITPGDATKILLSNLDGTAVDSGHEVLERLVRQVTAPVRWDLCMATLADLGVTAIIELPPAGTLAGLAKRALKGIEIVTLNTPDDLAAARDLIERHGSSPDARADAALPGRRLRLRRQLPAARRPGRGRGRTRRHDHRARRHPSGPIEVAAHASGVLTEWLAHHDDPVAPGQPLARIGAVSGRLCRLAACFASSTSAAPAAAIERPTS